MGNVVLGFFFCRRINSGSSKMSKVPDAATLLEIAAKNPQMDEFFARMPPLSSSDFEAMIKKNRRDRASWGGGDTDPEEGG